ISLQWLKPTSAKPMSSPTMKRMLGLAAGSAAKRDVATKQRARVAISLFMCDPLRRGQRHYNCRNAGGQWSGEMERKMREIGKWLYLMWLLILSGKKSAPEAPPRQPSDL